MKYLKTYENNNDKFKNKILLLDASASCKFELPNLFKTNLYLSKVFTVILCSSHKIEHHKTNLKNLNLWMESFGYYTGDGMQDGIDYIVKHKLEGPVIIFSDGMFNIHIEKLPNDISVIYTVYPPVIVGGEYEVFKNKIGEDYYIPRDCKSIKEYEAVKMSKKYNL